MAIFANSRWRTAAILKIVLSPYLSRELFDFDQIWYTYAYFSHPSRPINPIFLKLSYIVLYFDYLSYKSYIMTVKLCRVAQVIRA